MLITEREEFDKRFALEKLVSAYITNLENQCMEIKKRKRTNKKRTLSTEDCKIGPNQFLKRDDDV